MAATLRVTSCSVVAQEDTDLRRAYEQLDAEFEDSTEAAGLRLLLSRILRGGPEGWNPSGTAARVSAAQDL